MPAIALIDLPCGAIAAILIAPAQNAAFGGLHEAPYLRQWLRPQSRRSFRRHCHRRRVLARRVASLARCAGAAGAPERPAEPAAAGLLDVGRGWCAPFERDAALARATAADRAR